MAGLKSIRRAVRRAKAKRSFAKLTPVNVHRLIDDLIIGISLAECIQRSLSEQEIGTPEQITLDRARKCLGAVHDALEEIRG
jgi:hypothetical protein